jgi:tripartite-type tricarboxylate transporter receptor subunit TctC
VSFARRRFLQLAGGAVAAATVARRAAALDYPTRPVRLIVGFTPAGATDILARLIGQWLSERLGQPFVIENRPGAGSNIGTEAVVRAPADGHTLLLVAPANAINATLYDRLNFNFIRDIAPVAGLIRVANVMEVNPSVPAKTLAEFIAYAKANPGRINMASAGNGSQQHVAGELFKMMAGIEMVHVPYRGGGPALADLIGGQVQLFFGTTASTIELIRSGKLRALAVTTATRSEALPDVPTVAEFVPGYEASSWYGVGAPRDTPPEIIDRLNKEINAGLADPKIKTRLDDMGGTALTGSAAAFGKLIADETEKWGKVVKVSGAKAGPDWTRLFGRRLHEPLLDGDAVAARDNALLIVGLDLRMDEDRALPGVKQGSHRGRAVEPRDSFDTPKSAGLRRSGEIDARGGMARLHAGGAVVPIVEDDNREIVRLFDSDGRQAAHSHQRIAVARDHRHAAVRARERKPQADHRGGAHRAPEIEVQRMIAAGRDVIGRRAEAGDNQQIAAIGQKAGNEWAAVHHQCPSGL